jgi:hypothetical protein
VAVSELVGARVSVRWAGLAVVALVGCATDYHPGNPVQPGWLNRGSGQCFVEDAGGPGVTYSTGSDQPSSDACAPGQGGLVAVCWDQTTFPNPSVQGPACGYQDAGLVSCFKGLPPGNVYVCNQSSNAP